MLTTIVAFSAIANAATVNLYPVRPADIRPIFGSTTGADGWYESRSGTGNAEITNVIAANGAGSAEFTVSDVDSFVELGLYNHTFASNRLANLSALSYATWQQVDGTKAVNLQIEFDTDVTDADASSQGRLVYDPFLNKEYYGNPLADGVWQTWIVNRPTSQWWMALSDPSATNPCPQSNPCDYPEVLAAYPTIGFSADAGSPLILKAGSGWENFTGYADVPAVGTSQLQEIWDFEPEIVTPTGPTSKALCMKDGWSSFGPLFKNQGDCVSYVNSIQ